MRNVFNMGNNENLYNNLKSHFDKVVNTRNISLSSLGIDPEGFQKEAKEIILQRINSIAAERMDGENSE